MSFFIKKIHVPIDLSNGYRDLLADFLFEHLGEFRDPKADILEALRYAQEKGGWIYSLYSGENLAGVCVVLDTGMDKFVPKNFLVYLAVDASMRGQGLGKKLIETVQNDRGSAISLHVEHNNPAKRLYERLGFTSKYAEMRWNN